MGRKPRSEIGKNALAVLSDKVKCATETGAEKDVFLAKGILMGLELAEMLRSGTQAAEEAKRHRVTLNSLIANLEKA